MLLPEATGGAAPRFPSIAGCVIEQSGLAAMKTDTCPSLGKLSLCARYHVIVT